MEVPSEALHTGMALSYLHSREVVSVFSIGAVFFLQVLEQLVWRISFLAPWRCIIILLWKEVAISEPGLMGTEQDLDDKCNRMNVADR